MPAALKLPPSPLPITCHRCCVGTRDSRVAAVAWRSTAGRCWPVSPPVLPSSAQPAWRRWMRASCSAASSPVPPYHGGSGELFDESPLSPCSRPPRAGRAGLTGSRPAAISRRVGGDTQQITSPRLSLRPALAEAGKSTIQPVFDAAGARATGWAFFSGRVQAT